MTIKSTPLVLKPFFLCVPGAATQSRWPLFLRFAGTKLTPRRTPQAIEHNQKLESLDMSANHIGGAAVVRDNAWRGSLGRCGLFAAPSI